MTEPIIDVPEAWKRVLSRVRKRFPSAVIAGGALRDLCVGKPVKDVDIFCLAVDGWQDFLEREFKAEGLKTQECAIYIDGEPDREEISGRRIFAIYTVEIERQTFEIIVGDVRACDPKLFDINICQVWFDGALVGYTKDFADGIEQKTIRHLNPRPPHRVAERLARMAAKFPEFILEAA